jgi:hypothetical protein
MPDKGLCRAAGTVGLNWDIMGNDGRQWIKPGRLLQPLPLRQNNVINRR